MRKWILAASLIALTATAAHAEAPHRKRHHHHPVAVALPDTVTQDGKTYKVCNGKGAQDDCIEPRQAGLGFGNRPTDTYHPHD